MHIVNVFKNGAMRKVILSVRFVKQQFESGYTTPSPLFHYGGSPLKFRGNWEISRRDLHNHLFIAMVAADREFLDTDFEYSGPSTRSLIYCRIVAIIFMVLLILRHTLPIIPSGAGEYSLAIFTLLVLITIGILLHVYIMIRAFTAFRRQRHQVPHLFPTSSRGKLLGTAAISCHS